MEEGEQFRSRIFETAKSMALTPGFMLVILLLEKRENINQAIEEYNVQTLSGFQTSVKFIRSRLNSLYLDIKASYEKNFKKKEEREQKIKELEGLIFNKSEDYEKLVLAYDIINRFLYEKGVTKFDQRTIYDESNIILSNEVKGYG